METVAKGLVAVAALLVGACGGSSAPPSSPHAPAPAPPAEARSPADLAKVTDRYGRALGGARGLTIVDWEGPMANPAMRVFVQAAGDAALPMRVALSANDARLHFDGGSAGADGPRRTLTLEDTAPVEILLGNYPDSDTADDAHELRFEFTDAAGRQSSLRVPLREVDHDTAQGPGLDIAIDFRHDTENYFDTAQKRETATAAVRSWAYFIDGAAFDPVPAGDETTYVWTSHPDGFVEGFRTQNPTAYTGFLMYLYGFTSSVGASAASASVYGGWQSADGVSLPLRRSGSIAIELAGSHDRLGWVTTRGADDWYGDGTHADLWSTVVHEAGHALMLSAPVPRAQEFRNLGRVEDEAVRAYYGAYPAITHDFHLAGAHDPESRTKAFGNVAPSPMRTGRRLVTKLDLLVLRAVGYTLRDTSAFHPLAIAGGALTDANAGAPYAQPLAASGGIPCYHWTVTDGALPDGLALDPYDGVVHGTPTRTGSYAFTVTVEEYGGDAATQSFEITVG